MEYTACFTNPRTNVMRTALHSYNPALRAETCCLQNQNRDKGVPGGKQPLQLTAVCLVMSALAAEQLRVYVPLQ